MKGRLTYDADVARGTFSDKTSIDWWIWEPLETAHVTSQYDFPKLLTQAHWDAPVRFPSGFSSINRNDTVELHVPLDRYSEVSRKISIPTDINVRQLLEAIRAFYDRDVELSDLTEHDPKGGPYTEAAIDDLKCGKKVTWVHLMGCPEYMDPSELMPPDLAELWRANNNFNPAETTHRRDPFSCSGLVRYEGLRLYAGKLMLCLGS
jgi:hypothetical protein